MEALRQTYLYLESYHAAHGIFPTQREIGKAFGLTGDAISYRMKRMRELGWISMDGRRQSMVLLGMK